MPVLVVIFVVVGNFFSLGFFLWVFFFFWVEGSLLQLPIRFQDELEVLIFIYESTASLGDC